MGGVVYWVLYPDTKSAPDLAGRSSKPMHVRTADPNGRDSKHPITRPEKSFIKCTDNYVSVKNRAWRNSKRKKRVKRRSQQAIWRRAQKEKRDWGESKKVERAKKEVVATWNERTLAMKEKKGLCHSETSLLRA